LAKAPENGRGKFDNAMPCLHAVGPPQEDRSEAKRSLPTVLFDETPVP
jgi:hypothetical protein